MPLDTRTDTLILWPIYMYISFIYTHIFSYGYIYSYMLMHFAYACRNKPGVCFKSNEASVTNYFNSKRQTTCTFPSFSATLRRIIPGWTSTPPLRPSWQSPHLRNRSPWVWRKEKWHTEQDMMNKEVVLVGRCSSQPGTARCLVHFVFLLFRHAQIFGNKISNTVLFLSPADLRSFEQTMITTQHLPHLLDVHFIPSLWRPPALGVIFHLLATILESVEPLKNTCTWRGVSSTHFLKHFKSLQRSFLQPNPKFLVYSILSRNS